MLRKITVQLSFALALIATPFSILAQVKVVVIPLGGDEAPAPTSKAVFITPTTYTGDLGGASGADAKCQAEADSVGSLVSGKFFKAYLSTGLNDLSSSGRQFIRHDLPYLDVLGNHLGSDFEDFRVKSDNQYIIPTSGGSDIAPDFVSGAQGAIFVWSDTQFNGLLLEEDHTVPAAPITICGGWIFDDATGVRQLTGVVGFEAVDYVPFTFTPEVGSRFCDDSSHLLCVEQ